MEAADEMTQVEQDKINIYCTHISVVPLWKFHAEWDRDTVVSTFSNTVLVLLLVVHPYLTLTTHLDNHHPVTGQSEIGVQQFESFTTLWNTLCKCLTEHSGNLRISTVLHQELHTSSLDRSCRWSDASPRSQKPTSTSDIFQSVHFEKLKSSAERGRAASRVRERAASGVSEHAERERAASRVSEHAERERAASGVSEQAERERAASGVSEQAEREKAARWVSEQLVRERAVGASGVSGKSKIPVWVQWVSWAR